MLGSAVRDEWREIGDIVHIVWSDRFGLMRWTIRIPRSSTAFPTLFTGFPPFFSTSVDEVLKIQGLQNMVSITVGLKG